MKLKAVAILLILIILKPRLNIVLYINFYFTKASYSLFNASNNLQYKMITYHKLVN